MVKKKDDKKLTKDQAEKKILSLKWNTKSVIKSSKIRNNIRTVPCALMFMVLIMI